MSLGAAASDPPKEDAAAAVREAAKAAEVHGVGAYGPFRVRLHLKEVTDWAGLVAALRAGDGPAGRVRGLLPERTRKLLDDPATVIGEDPFAGERALRLVGETFGELRQLLARPDLFDGKSLEGVELGKEAKDLLALGPKRSAAQTIRMNRLLLAAAFPKALAPPPPDLGVVRVAVKAGRDVVLVLSAGEPCRWEVEVEKGGRVAGVVLTGVNHQQVAGVDCPVFDRAACGPDGKARKWPALLGYDEKDKGFERFRAGVKEVVGRDFDDFQGVEKAPEDGFVVRPVRRK
jgi:hypothetical protein